MSVIRIANPDRIRPSHVVLIVLTYMTLLGGYLLTSAPERAWLPDGARHWKADSLLPAVVELMNVNNSRPTVYGDDIKFLIAGIAAGLAALVFGVAVAGRSRSGDEISESDLVIREDNPDDEDQVPSLPVTKRQIPPLLAAQCMMVLYVLWSFASSIWAGSAWDYALSGSALLGIYTLWAFGLGMGLNRIGARKAGFALLVAALAASIIAMWYVGERNAVLRAQYPFGNPLVLAACLLPGLCIAMGIIGHGFSSAIGQKRSVGWAEVVGGFLLFGVIGWAFMLSDSRGPTVGLAAGVFAMIWLPLKRKGRVLLGGLGVLAVVVAGIYAWSYVRSSENTGRVSTIHTRLYAWQYALNLASETGVTPIVGNGQGAYVLKADSFARGDVQENPMPLEYAIRHAHNEYLEIFADLGAIGVILFLGSLLMTLKAAIECLPSLTTRSLRWTLIGLTASLVALAVSEVFGVALRFIGVPLAFYTVLGLIWAICTDPRKDYTAILSKAPLLRYSTLVVAVVLGLGALELTRGDFEAARSGYKLREEMNKTNWERALQLSDIAYKRRLPPYRRLTAEEERIHTRLERAAFLRSQAQNLLAEARQAQNPSDVLVSVWQKLQACQEVSLEALDELDVLLKKSPGCWNAGWLAYQIRNLLMDYAYRKQDSDMYQENLMAAIAAIEQEIHRRPCSPVIAVTYAGLLLDKMPPEEILPWLARPLRYDSPPTEYYTILEQMPVTPEQLEAIRDRARQALNQEDPSQWENPLAPEFLRLIAMINMNRNQPKEAIQNLQDAITLYGRLPSDAQIGRAMSLKELADAQFVDNPADPQRVIDSATEAIKAAPDSGRGREIARMASERMLPCSLVKGQEEGVRKKLVEQMPPETPDDTIDAVLGSEYTELARTILLLQATDLYDQLEAWLNRAVELNPQDAGARIVQAHVAYMNNDDQACADYYRQALNLGVNPGLIVEDAAKLLFSRPDSEPLNKLWNQFVEAFGVAPFEEILRQSSQPATQPSSQPKSQPMSQPTSQVATQPVTQSADWPVE